METQGGTNKASDNQGDDKGKKRHDDLANFRRNSKPTGPRQRRQTVATLNQSTLYKPLCSPTNTTSEPLPVPDPVVFAGQQQIPDLPPPLPWSCRRGTMTQWLAQGKWH